MEVKIDVFIFLQENGEKKKIKDCSYHKEFMYKRLNFIIVSDNTYYRVCYLNKDKEYYSIWSRLIKKDGTRRSYNEILSEFRKEYDKNSINEEKINNFITKKS